jgi:hypothetical protein
MRFEDLGSSYIKALKQIGIVNPIPLTSTNATDKKVLDYVSMYSPAAVMRAKQVFAIYMRHHGYDFPKHWGDVKVTQKDRILFSLQNSYKSIYWKYLRNYVLRLEENTRRR